MGAGAVSVAPSFHPLVDLICAAEYLDRGNHAPGPGWQQLRDLVLDSGTATAHLELPLDGSIGHPGCHRVGVDDRAALHQGEREAGWFSRDPDFAALGSAGNGFRDRVGDHFCRRYALGG